MRYKCLILDHDETVVQTEKTIGYPFFRRFLEKVRPGITVSLQDYAKDCHDFGFVDMCRKKYAFTDDELKEEHSTWTQYLQTHVPEIFPGIEQIVRLQKQSGGLLCVVSHSGEETIRRDYRVHFGLEPDCVYGWDLPEHQRKPNTYPLEQILNTYSLSPTDILVVDDAQLACQMAKPLGVDVAYAAWGKKDFPTLDAQMRKICKYTFETTEELKFFLFK